METDELKDIGGLENTVYRDHYRKLATKEQLEYINEEFMKGNWTVFGVWAVEVLDGRIDPGPAQQDTPHGAFWSRFLSSSSVDERKEFLDFLLRAQLANRCVKDRPFRAQVPGFTSLCRKTVVDYLSAFEEPKHVTDPETIIGHCLTYFSDYPDERMVVLAGMYGLAETIPVLERYLMVQRRFHQLHVDYCTSPKEIDTLFITTLRALVDIGISGNEEAVQEVFRKVMSGLDKKKETVWYEVFSHNNYTGTSHEYVQTKEFETGQGITKWELLEMAIRALEKDGKERKELFGLKGDPGKYSWIQPSLDGGGVIRGDRLYFIGNFKIECFDIPSARIIFRVETGRVGAYRELSCYYEQVHFTSEGDLLMITFINTHGPSELRVWRAITFDKDTGEVKGSFDMAFEPVRAWGPNVWPRADGCIVFRMAEEKRVWKQDRDGKLLWDEALPEQFVIVKQHGDLLAIMSKEDLTVRKADTNEVVFKRALEDLRKDLQMKGEIRDDFVLVDDGFYLFDREGTIMAFDLEGRLRWQKQPEGAYWLSDPTPKDGGLIGHSNDEFFVITRDGEVSSFKKAGESNMKEHLVTEDGVWMHVEHMGKMHFTSFDGKTDHEHEIPYQTRFVAVDKDHLMIRWFEDDWSLACLPRKNW